MREPHRAYIVAMLADMTRFRTFADVADPEVPFEKLAEYHRAVEETVENDGGQTIDYAGDGAFAIFNDPAAIADPEYHAANAALAVRERFAALAAKWVREGYRLGLRIGMDAGFATLGRIGYEGHYSYGAIGGTVNSAALIAHNARSGQIFASQKLASSIGDRVATRPVADIPIEGLAQPLKVVEIVALQAPS